MGVAIASSPGPSPAVKAAACKAAVPELKLTAYFASTHAENRSSNSPTFGPVVSQSDFRTSTTAWTSASSRLCRPYGNNFSRTGVPPWIASLSSFVGKALMLAVRGASALRIGAGLNRLRKNSGFVSGHRFSDAASRPKISRPLLRRRRNGLRSAVFRRHQFFQFPPRHPAFIAVARITEAFPKRLSADPVFRFPPGMRRLNHVHILSLEPLP